MATIQKRGRPSRYSSALATRICKLLEQGQTLISICKDEKFPDASTVRKWAVKDLHGFFPQYARARDIGLDAMAEHVLEIAATPNKTQRITRKVDSQGNAIGDAEVIIADSTDRNRLQVDTLKWYLAHLAPKRYSSRIPLEKEGDGPESNLLKELADAIREPGAGMIPGDNRTIKPFGPKARRFIRRKPEDDALINILRGSIRSSKTWAINAKLVTHMALGWWPGGTGLITGKSKTTIKTNVLTDIREMVGKSNYRYNSSSGELQLFNRPFRVVGAADESRHESIKGSTVGIWIADEGTLYPKSFFEMATSRLSLPGSRAYMSTNPADPFHYLKKEWMDDAEKLKINPDTGRPTVWFEDYTLDDNPNIEESKKEEYKRMYTGVFYERNILGRWVIASGAIYRDVISNETWYTNATRPLGLLSRGGHREHWVLVDVGTVNPCVFVDAYDNGDTIFLDREYYFDSRARMQQKTDAEYADDMLVFVNGLDPLNPADRIKAREHPVDPRTWPGIIIDPSAASFKVELVKRGFWVQDADNEVEAGISMVATMLHRKKLRINEQNCPEGKREMVSYAWDEKRAENGKEQPIKAHDHYPDAVRYGIKTRVSPYRLAA